MSYVSTKKAIKYYGVTSQTLRNWTAEGRIKYKRTSGNHRVYFIPEKDEDKESKTNIIYTRVSSSKQRDDLERQTNFLLEKFPTYEVVKDIGSGLNFKRKGLISILDRAEEGDIGKIVVFSKDRLCRFGFELLEHLFRKYSVELLVLNKEDKSPQEEFSEDILSIIQVFSCRWNGRRRYKNKNEEIQNDTDSGSETNIKIVE